jgi:hypothetical protein
MGWHIVAWVEVHLPWAAGMTDIPGVETWYPMMDASLLIDRNDDAFGCLFGAANRANFRPVAADRGLPETMSGRVREEAERYAEADSGTGFVWPSWVTLAEIEQVDWDEPALLPDQRLHQFIRTPSGEWVFETKSTWDANFAQAVGHNMERALLGQEPPWTEGQEWQVGDRLFRAVRLRRRDAMDEGWQSLLTIMRELARRFSPEGVRLVVWFYA